MGCPRARTYCCIVVLLSLVTESLSIRCFHCGWSDDSKSYREKEAEEELTYPIAKLDMRDACPKISNPPTRDEVGRCCRPEVCNGPNSACMKWSFISNHPVNVTYMCVSNPGKKSGCYRQQIPNKDLLEIEVCLCDENECNRAANTRSLTVLSLVLTALMLFLS